MQRNNRLQLTLFVDPREAQTIEAVRKRYNPIQFELIRSHVTLCREDEIEDLERVIFNLNQLPKMNLVLEFDRPKRFHEGKGLLLPGLDGNGAFQQLRKKILNGIVRVPKFHEPHITLMHPRNSVCSDDIFKEISAFNFPGSISFNCISLIEQENGGEWKMIRDFNLS